MKNSTPHRTSHLWWLAAPFAVPLLTRPLAQALGAHPLAEPWLVPAVLAPFGAAWAWRIWRDAAREKRELQEKFDREDAALLNSLRQ